MLKSSGWADGGHTGTVKGPDQGGSLTQYQALGFPWHLRSLGWAVLWGQRGHLSRLGKGIRAPVLAPSHSAPVASPSRDSDSRMVLQVEAISEMDCHSSSRVSLLASDMTGHKEVGSAREAQASLPSACTPPCIRLTFADGVPKRQGSWQEGGPQLRGWVTLVLTTTGAAWAILRDRNGNECGHTHHHHCAHPCLLGSRALFLLTWLGGVSLPALGAGGMAVVARRRSGVVLGRTGASSDKELGRAGTAQH